MTKSILVLGASSAIAHQTTRLFASNRWNILLCARSAEKLQTLASDCKVLGASSVEIHEFDAMDFSQHANVFEWAREKAQTIDVVFIAHGSLPDNTQCANDAQLAVQEFTLNATSVISLSTHAALLLEGQHNQGTLAVISSVAGDRGRASNYVYGSAKAAVSTFLSGLRNRLASQNIAVVCIKPGFIDTPMTAHLPKNALFASAQKAGGIIYNAIIHRKDDVYVPGFWRYIMLIIRHIPEFVFKKLHL